MKMNMLLIDNLEWHKTKDSLPIPNTECYIRIQKPYPNGDFAPIYDIIRVEVLQSYMPHNYGETFFYRAGDYKRNVFSLNDVDAWADIPVGDPNIRQLLPCPFCGGKAELHHVDAYEDDYGDMPEHWWIGCENQKCLMLVQTGLFLDKEKAIEAWNTRKV